MTLWHYTCSRTVAADLKVGDWILSGDECDKVVGLTRNERSTTILGAHGDGVSVEYVDARDNPTETWPHTYPNDHLITLIHFKERD